jgi:hypothetical protein
VQSRSSAGARELSGAWDDRLQGRGRALGVGAIAEAPGKLAAALIVTAIGGRKPPLQRARPDRTRHLSRDRVRDFARKFKKTSNFLKCPASKSLERNEANQINNRYDEHGSR